MITCGHLEIGDWAREGLDFTGLELSRWTRTGQQPADEGFLVCLLRPERSEAGPGDGDP